MRVYSLFDRKLKEYGSLVVGANDESTVRALKEMLLSSGSATVFKYPGDFDLFYLGDFNVDSGELDPVFPQLVVNCEEVLNAER